MKVKNHKWIVFLLICSLFAGMWSGGVVKGEGEEGTTTVSETTEEGRPESVRIIKEVTIKGVEPPESISDAPNTQEIQVETVAVETGTVETPSVETVEVEKAIIIKSTWEPNEDKSVYRLSVSLEAEAGYKFKVQGNNLDLDIVIKDVRGKEIDLKDKNLDIRLENGRAVITCDFQVEPPEPIKIDEVPISNIVIPKGGQSLPEETPTIDTKGIEILKEHIEWKDEDGKSITDKQAKYDTTYKLWIPLQAEKGYEFRDWLKITVNDILDKNIAWERDGNNKNIIIVKIKFTTDKDLSSTSPLETPTVTPPDSPNVEPSASQAPVPILQPTIPPTTYTITLDVNGGTLSQKSITFTAETMSGVKLPTPTKKDSLFLGWYQGKKRVSQIMEAKDISLKAQWASAKITMKYWSTISCVKKLKLSSDVKLEKIEFDKKYKKYFKVDQKKLTIKGKKYVKKATVNLTIDGKKLEKGVTVKMELPQPEIKIVSKGRPKAYAIGIYRTFKLSYTYAPGATKAVAEYSKKKKKGYKKCGKALNQLKGGSASIRKGTTIYMRVTIYYGKNASKKSAFVTLKG
ncbi:MAG: InlB B-repeat-containing protein [Roseburia sp.]|nr:InlB B-repeat-containing protein [Roseburia sp.]